MKYKKVIEARFLARPNRFVAQYEVATGRMFRDGFLFYQSVNGVWFTEIVPAEYLRLR